MMILNIIACALISAACGGRFNTENSKVPRVISAGAFAILLAFQFQGIDYAIGWLLAFAIIRLLPTAGLITAAEDTLPVRNGSWLRTALYDATMTVWKRLPHFMTSWSSWGAVYGVIRTAPILPIAWYLGNPWLCLFVGIGFIYWIIGVVCCKVGKGWQPVTWAEVVVGGLMGASL